MLKEHSNFIKSVGSEVAEESGETSPHYPHRQALVRAHWRQELTANDPTQVA